MTKFILLFLFYFASAEGKVLVGSIPDTSSKDEWDFIKDLDSVYDGRIKFRGLPDRRSISYVTKGLQDFHYPVLLPLSNVKKKFDYKFSTLTVRTVIYAVYVSKKNLNIALHNLQNYRIEGESGHVDFFDFKVHPSSCAECSFKKVESGRIDGYIYPALKGDQLIEKLGLKNIDSYYFDSYEIKFALPKNSRGESIDALLSDLFFKLQKTALYRKKKRELVKIHKSWKPSRD